MVRMIERTYVRFNKNVQLHYPLYLGIVLCTDRGMTNYHPLMLFLMMIVKIRIDACY